MPKSRYRPPRPSHYPDAEIIMDLQYQLIPGEHDGDSSIAQPIVLILANAQGYRFLSRYFEYLAGMQAVTCSR